MSRVLLGVLFLFVGTGQGASALDGPPKEVVPRGWKRVEVCRVSFLLPKNMQKRDVRGIDSCVGQFANDDMELNLDYGMYGGPIDRHNALNFKEESIEIDGKRAQMAFYVNASEYAKKHPRCKYVAGVYIVTSESVFKGQIRGKTSLSMTMCGRTEKEQGLAGQIFRSIRFKDDTSRSQ